MNTGSVETDGDTLYYEVRGAGPPLLMIHGGVLDASGFARAAEMLAPDYTVITYDRRAYSRSTRRDPQNFEVGQQARDAVAVLHAVGHDAAIVFGSSAGAIIGLEMARSQPQAVSTLVAHEPPVMRVLPDADQLLAEYAKIYLTAWTEGPLPAFQRFTALNAIPRMEQDRAALAAEDMERTRDNIEFFVKQEMLPLSSYKPDIAMIRDNGVKVILAVGELSRDKSYGRTAAIVATQLAGPLAIFPGHHTSYMGLAEEWVPALRRVIGDG